MYFAQGTNGYLAILNNIGNTNNSVAANDLPALIQSVYRTLTQAGVEPPEPVKQEPAVPIKKSVFPDHIVCLEDGKKLKML